jgi:hypothetical protein
MRSSISCYLFIITVFVSGCSVGDGDEKVRALAVKWPEYEQPFVDPENHQDDSSDPQPTQDASIDQPRSLGAGTTFPVARRNRPNLIPAVKPVEQWGLQETAIDSLGRIGAPAVPGLIQALEHPNRDQRLRAAKVLARIGPDAAQAVPILVELLNDQDEEIRKASARALGQIGPAAESAVEPLLNMIQ